MTEEATVYVRWATPRPIGSVLEDGHPRELPGSESGFDLSWAALDAWSRSQATGQPCELILTGYSKRPDGFYWYSEAINPAFLREVLGWTEKDGKLVPACPECDGYPKHFRGCSLA